MDKGLGVLIESQRVPRSTPPVPRLRLLIEWEPRSRVFFGNLADLIRGRRVPPIRITSRPGRFWDDVFVPTGISWSSFMESLLWHLLMLIVLVWAQSRVWVPVKQFEQRNAFHGPIAYYPPAPSFPATEGRAQSPPAESRAKHASRRAAERQASQHQAAMPVNPEQKPKLVTPPDIKQAAARPPDVLNSPAVPPMAPLSAAGGWRRNTLAGPSGVVAPPPQVGQTAAPRLALPQTSAVAPAPQLGGPSAERVRNSPNADGLRVVPPPPSVQNATNSGRTGPVTSLGTGPTVVPPAPSVRSTANAGNARMNSMAGSSQVVPPPPSVSGGNSVGVGRLSSSLGAAPNVIHPPPSVEGASNANRDARRGSMTGPGSQVVPPPPSVPGPSNSTGAGRLSSLPAGGPNVVPPSPSVPGAGNIAGDARAGSMAGAGPQVVPPAPSVQGSDGNAGSTRLAALSGAGSEVVAPAPSVENAGNAGAGGRIGSLSGDGSQVVAPPPSVASAGNTGSGGVLRPMDPDQMIAPSSPTAAVNNENKPVYEDLPLGLIGVVWAPPGSSYFSNFEVFVAKRRVGKGQLQLIKLVYEFLPYQRRLSEYDLNNMPARIIKLRVIPDPTCNESLEQMIEPTTDPDRPVTEYPKLPAALSTYDPNAVLPCFRTTAEDFQKAMSHGR